MSDAEIGFEIQGRTYPFVRHDDWKMVELKAVREVTGYSYFELLGGKAGAAEINAGFATVAFWRGNPEADEDQIVQLIGQLKPSDIKWKGPVDLADEDDARPPDENGSEPSESTEPSSVSTPETSSPEPSGEPSSQSTSSDSGPPNPSES